jgi:hypothetical protein
MSPGPSPPADAADAVTAAAQAAIAIRDSFFPFIACLLSPAAVLGGQLTISA